MNRHHLKTRLSSLEARTYVFFTSLILVTILSMQVVSYRFNQRSLLDADVIARENSTERLAYQMDSYLKTMEHVLQAVLVDSQTQYIAREGARASIDELQAYAEFLASFLLGRDDIATITLLAADGSLITSNLGQETNPYLDPYAKPWFSGAVALGGDIYHSSAHVQNLFYGQYPWVVSMSVLAAAPTEMQSAAVLLLDINFTRIREMCRPVEQEYPEYIFLLDTDGRYVYHPQQQLVFSGIKDEPTGQLAQAMLRGLRTHQALEKSFVMHKAAGGQWTIVSAKELHAGMAQWRPVQTTYATIGLAAFIIVGLAANFLANRVSDPVKKLCRILQTVDKDNMDITVELDAAEEIRQLAGEFNAMLAKIRELIVQIQYEQSLKREMEIKALEAQINPHFLYNTLDSIIWMSEMGRSEEVVKMTSALAKLFRIGIGNGKEIISLGEELQHAQSYLVIQKMRYREHFSYAIDVESRFHMLSCPRLVVQPLVENAIYHGLKNVTYEGTIRITVSQEDQTLVIHVTDNGIGMDPLLFESLVSGKQHGSDLVRSGIGIRNVHQRIQLLFGDSYGLAFTCGLGSDGRSSTCISIRIPLAVQTQTQTRAQGVLA